LIAEGQNIIGEVPELSDEEDLELSEEKK